MDISAIIHSKIKIVFPERKFVIGTVKNHFTPILFHNKKMPAADDPISRLRIIQVAGNHSETLAGVGDLTEVEVFKVFYGHK